MVVSRSRSGGGVLENLKSASTLGLMSGVVYRHRTILKTKDRLPKEDHDVAMGMKHWSERYSMFTIENAENQR